MSSIENKYFKNYLKYKIKYLNLKKSINMKQTGGGNPLPIYSIPENQRQAKYHADLNKSLGKLNIGTPLIPEIDFTKNAPQLQPAIDNKNKMLQQLSSSKPIGKPPGTKAKTYVPGVSKPALGPPALVPSAPSARKGTCGTIPNKTEERRGRKPGQEREKELFCPSGAPYLCGEDTNAVKEADSKGKNPAICRVNEHDCNFKGTPLGKSNIAKVFYQTSNDKSLSARYYENPSKSLDPQNCNEVDQYKLITR